MSTKGASGDIYTNDMIEKRVMRMENPFTMKVGQVFTGFGIGCGVGIGVGRPLNLGAIPALGQVMSATRGASDAFSGVHRHVNYFLRKVGAKNIEAGIGCGVGFGHGFGVGLAVKPVVLHQIQSKLLKMTTRVMTKLGINSDTTSFPENMVKEQPSHGNPAFVKTLSNSTTNIKDGKTIVPSQQTVNTQYSSRTDQVLDNFLKNPLLKEESHEQIGELQLENNVLQMVLKHQTLIEELIQENQKLRQILVQQLKVEPNFTSRSISSCTDCFQCRTRQRKR